MNILFVLYNDFNSNSASHVHNFANELVKLGHDCAVAVPANKESISNLGPASYQGIHFPDALEGRFTFRDGRAPDILHAWTPREVVRAFCAKLRDKHGSRLFVHMEDNEWHLLELALGAPLRRILLSSDSELDKRVQAHLSHPRKGREFLSSADGITVIIDRLKELVPGQKPVLELWPSAEPNLFRPMPRKEHSLTTLGVPRNSAVLVYTGNVHNANAHEVRSLYLAVAILNREGQPTTLVRAGRDYCPFLGPEEQWGRQHSIELGMVPHKQIPEVLAVADILVQPGRPDPFNDYRFPSKLPEFLSAGRPVIVPKTNIASRMTHKKHAFVLENANALAIAGAVQEILGNRALYQQLANGATEFFEQHLSWSRSADKLNRFYEKHFSPPEQVSAAFTADLARRN